ncbi:ABC transporter substrate-binding protein [Streptosporangium fragile]|uniref:ABC transporter substrate-binding protein n=1 Tax=Streptosporangium fragile TaxID=46186 RepID=A0ABN3W3Q1_9ACTN
MKRTHGTAALLALSVLTLTACGGSAGSTAGTASGGGGYATGATLTMAIPADPGSLHPLLNATGEAATVNAFTYDQLIGMTGDGKLVPQLAEKWESTPTEATFTLRKGVTCADGTELTAGTVADNFRFVADTENGSPFIGAYVPAGVRVEHDDAAGTVTITSKEPASFLARMVGLMPIACAKALKDPKAVTATAEGTGPYKLTEVKPGQSYTLELRQDYAWGPDGATAKAEGLPAKVVLQVVPSQTTAANMLMSGQLTIANVNGPDRTRVAAIPGVTTVDIPTRPGLVFFNHTEGRPGADAGVRKALAMAMDRSALGKVSSAGLGRPLTTLVTSDPPPCTGRPVDDVVPAHDVEGAKAALDALGWKPGADGVREKDGKRLTVSLLYPTRDGASLASAVELLAQQWKAVGVEVTPKPAAGAQVTDVLFKTRDFDVSWTPIDTELPSMWTGILSGPTPPNGGNFSGTDNAEYRRLSTAAQSKEGDASCGDWIDAERALFKEADLVPVVVNTNSYFGKGAEFRMAKGLIVPTSIRMLKG